MEGLELIDRWIRGHSITTPNAAWQKTAFAASKSEYRRGGEATNCPALGSRLGSGGERNKGGGVFFLVEFSSIAGEGSLGVPVVEYRGKKKVHMSKNPTKAP
jgi:hypothetical protein